MREEGRGGEGRRECKSPRINELRPMKITRSTPSSEVPPPLRSAAAAADDDDDDDRRGIYGPFLTAAAATSIYADGSVGGGSDGGDGGCG